MALTSKLTRLLQQSLSFMKSLVFLRQQLLMRLKRLTANWLFLSIQTNVLELKMQQRISRNCRRLTRFSQTLRRGRSMISTGMMEKERTEYTPLMIGSQLMSTSELSTQNSKNKISRVTPRDTDFHLKRSVT